jgi:type III secretory pathway component EscV
MAEIDRELPFGRYRPEPPSREPKTFVGLLHAILTQPHMLVSAHLLMVPVLLTVAVIFGKPVMVAVLAAATVTLLVWALLRERTNKANSAGEENPGSYPKKKE